MAVFSAISSIGRELDANVADTLIHNGFRNPVFTKVATPSAPPRRAQRRDPVFRERKCTAYIAEKAGSRLLRQRVG